MAYCLHSRDVADPDTLPGKIQLFHSVRILLAFLHAEKSVERSVFECAHKHLMLTICKL